MKTTFKKLKHVISEAVASGQPYPWVEAKKVWPASVVSGFEKTVLGDYEHSPEEFEFSYAPITYFTDKYGGEDEDDMEAKDHYNKAYAEAIDELWHCNDMGEWLLYNY